MGMRRTHEAATVFLLAVLVTAAHGCRGGESGAGGADNASRDDAPVQGDDPAPAPGGGETSGAKDASLETLAGDASEALLAVSRGESPRSERFGSAKRVRGAEPMERADVTVLGVLANWSGEPSSLGVEARLAVGAFGVRTLQVFRNPHEAEFAGDELPEVRDFFHHMTETGAAPAALSADDCQGESEPACRVLLASVKEPERSALAALSGRSSPPDLVEIREVAILGPGEGGAWRRFEAQPEDAPLALGDYGQREIHPPESTGNRYSHPILYVCDGFAAAADMGDPSLRRAAVKTVELGGREALQRYQAKPPAELVEAARRHGDPDRCAALITHLGR